ncbi:UvrABC system protein C [Planococcus massiliensis]|uniref:UvrABC system protein C n=1 Tax=Planococcus massiliensis TaxID=1499687 RepID=A0A098EIM1_9BACL|nr:MULTISPECIES: GIY-YIG nuclease family protein [Planococcus]MCJ1908387.1 GIY-YIG nuclease family protein [Planococcus ruber]CEG22128.1 UvrABC system protein C [Planococcus massiliensis]
MKEKIHELLKKENYAFDNENWKSIENVPFLLNDETTKLLNKIKLNMGMAKGIYIFCDSNQNILYIGKGAPIYNRIRRHFAKLKKATHAPHGFFQAIQSPITIHWVEIEQPEKREIVEHMLAYTLEPVYKKWYVG